MLSCIGVQWQKECPGIGFSGGKYAPALVVVGLILPEHWCQRQGKFPSIGVSGMKNAPALMLVAGRVPQCWCYQEGRCSSIFVSGRINVPTLVLMGGGGSECSSAGFSVSVSASALLLMGGRMLQPWDSRKEHWGKGQKNAPALVLEGQRIPQNLWFYGVPLHPSKQICTSNFLSCGTLCKSGDTNRGGLLQMPMIRLQAIVMSCQY